MFKRGLFPFTICSLGVNGGRMRGTGEKDETQIIEDDISEHICIVINVTRTFG